MTVEAPNAVKMKEAFVVLPDDGAGFRKALGLTLLNLVSSVQGSPLSHNNMRDYDFPVKTGRGLYRDGKILGIVHGNPDAYGGHLLRAVITFNEEEVEVPDGPFNSNKCTLSSVSVIEVDTWTGKVTPLQEMSAKKHFTEAFYNETLLASFLHFI